MSPTARTLAWLRKTGVTAGVVERWVTIPGHPGGGIRKDLFSSIDIIALRHGRIIGVQCTSGDHHAEHLTKVRRNAELREWLLCGGQYELWSWTKKGKGRTKWLPRVDNLECVAS